MNVLARLLNERGIVLSMFNQDYDDEDKKRYYIDGHLYQCVNMGLNPIRDIPQCVTRESVVCKEFKKLLENVCRLYQNGWAKVSSGKIYQLVDGKKVDTLGGIAIKLVREVPIFFPKGSLVLVMTSKLDNSSIIDKLYKSNKEVSFLDVSLLYQPLTCGRIDLVHLHIFTLEELQKIENPSFTFSVDYPFETLSRLYTEEIANKIVGCVGITKR